MSSKNRSVIRKQAETDFKLFYADQAPTDRDTQVRVRGRSNLVETKEASLLWSMAEQKEEQKRQGHLKQAQKYAFLFHF